MTNIDRSLQKAKKQYICFDLKARTRADAVKATFHPQLKSAALGTTAASLRFNASVHLRGPRPPQRRSGRFSMAPGAPPALVAAEASRRPSR